jgi:hypothetical protein
MEQPFLSLIGDPKLIEIALCLGLIGALRWLAAQGRQPMS